MELKKKKIEKKNLKKKKKIWKFFFGFSSNFNSAKSPASGKEKNRKSGIRTFENSPDFRTGRDVRLSEPYIWRYFALLKLCLALLFFFQ